MSVLDRAEDAPVNDSDSLASQVLAALNADRGRMLGP
jgi:hypothetical protein